MRKNQSKRPRVVFDTPGRECQHADKGCCPKCLDPMQRLLVKKPQRRANNNSNRNAARAR